MLYIFNKNDELLKILSNYENFEYTEKLNNQNEVSLESTEIEYLIKDNKLGFFNKNDEFKLFLMDYIKEFKEVDSSTIFINCINDIYVLNNKIIEDRRVVNDSVNSALEKVLENTEYEPGLIEQFENKDINFYFISSMKALNDIIETYNCEFTTRIIINPVTGRISNKFIDIKHRIGQDTGLRFTYDTNLTSIEKTPVSDVYNVLYGFGKSLETEDGGYSRKLDFSSVNNNKKYIEDTESIVKYGRKEGVFEDSNIDDPAILLNKTREKLQETKNRKYSYEVNVEDLSNFKGFEHYRYNIGDSIIIMDEEDNLVIEARIIAINSTNEETTLTLGYFQNSLFDEDIEESFHDLKDKVDNIINSDKEINDNQYPDVLPNVPVVEAQGLFSSVILSWTYENKTYYTYEVFASKTKDFNPAAANRIFEGKASSFLHEVKPSETWYYRVRTKNTHDKFTSYSTQVSAATRKIQDGTQYFEELAIDHALIASLDLDKATVGKLKAKFLDVYDLVVRDGNNNKTLEIDSFGRVKLNVTELSVLSKEVETKESSITKINTAKTEAITAAGIDATTKANDAKSQAINSAATDAQNKATKALNDSKVYTGAEITKVNTNMTNKFAEIKTTTDGITKTVSNTNKEIETVKVDLSNKTSINEQTKNNGLELIPQGYKSNSSNGFNCVSNSNVTFADNQITVRGNLWIKTVPEFIKVDRTKVFYWKVNAITAGALFYVGIERYDKNKNVIDNAANNATVYFVNSTTLNGAMEGWWTETSKETAYIKLRILCDWNNTGGNTVIKEVSIKQLAASSQLDTSNEILDVTTTKVNEAKAEIIVETNGIKQSVSALEETTVELNGKFAGYITNGKFSEYQQSAESFQFTIENRGTVNLIKNSTFSSNRTLTDGWNGHTANVTNNNIPQLWVYGYSSDWSYKDAEVNTLVIKDQNNGQLLGGELGANQVVNLVVGETYTLSFYCAAHRAGECYATVRGTTASDYGWVRHEPIIPKSGGSDLNNWNYITMTFTAQRTTTIIEFGIKGYTDYNPNMFIAKPMLNKGNIAAPFTIRANEINKGITTADEKGLTVAHSSGSSASFNHDGSIWRDNFGREGIRINNGGMALIDPVNNEWVGFMRTSRENTGHNGITISTSNVGDYISFGCSKEGNIDNDWTSSAAILIENYDGNHGAAGVHFWSMKNMTRDISQVHNHTNYIQEAGNIYMNDHYIYFGDYGQHLSWIGNSGENSARTCMYGNDEIALGCYKGSTGYYFVHFIEGSPISRAINYCNWDFNYKNLYNVNISRSALNTRSRTYVETKALFSETDSTRYVYKKKEFKYDEKEGKYLLRLSIPSQYQFSEYTILNIVKYGKGDVWISEEMETRFILESDCPMKVNIEIDIELNNQNDEILRYNRADDKNATGDANRPIEEYETFETYTEDIKPYWNLYKNNKTNKKRICNL